MQVSPAVVEEIKKRITAITEESSSWKTLVPVMYLSTENKLHYWLFGGSKYLNGETSSGLLRGDLGYSLVSGKKVTTVVKERIGWSLLLGIMSMIVALTCGVTFGVFSIKWQTTYTTLLIYVLISIPGFWMAIFLMMTLSNPMVINILPSFGLPEAGAGFFAYLPYLILPTICYSYGAFSFIAKSTNNAMEEQLAYQHVLVAKAKGLSENRVLIKHVLRNSMIPLVTIFTEMIPIIIGGSVIIESIFNIPGIGGEIYKAITNNDYPVVVGITFFTGIITILSYTLAEFLYLIIDPRIKNKA